MKKVNKAGNSYRESLIEDLRGDDDAQLEYIKANFEENGDLPSAILSAIPSLNLKSANIKTVGNLFTLTA